MTTLNISQSGHYQYNSNGLLTNEKIGTSGVATVVSYNILHIDGFNGSANTRYFQLWPFSIGAGVHPVKVIRVGGNATFSWAPPVGGFRIGDDGTGAVGDLWWAFSSTPDTYTVTADTAYVMAVFLAMTSRQP